MKNLTKNQHEKNNIDFLIIIKVPQMIKIYNLKKISN